MVDSMPSWFSSLTSVSADYLFCLVVFGIAVIVYTTYGGFHAVVWTDVMQGIVMVVGVIIITSGHQSSHQRNWQKGFTKDGNGIGDGRDGGNVAAAFWRGDFVTSHDR